MGGGGGGGGGLDVRLDFGFPSNLTAAACSWVRFSLDLLLAFRSLIDGSCFYSATSVRLSGINLLINLHILRILTSLALLTHEVSV